MFEDIKMELCWNITTRCNQSCKYCHRFLNMKDLSFEQNLSILEKLINEGVKEITWTGGESLLVDYLPDLLQIASLAGVDNKIITNGILLTDELLKKIHPFLSRVSLSIDTIDDILNDEIGRGTNHLNVIIRCLEDLKKYDISVTINTVLNKLNLEKIDELGAFLSNYKLKEWRIFKFMPLRGLSKVYREMFEIDDETYRFAVATLKNKFEKMNICTRKISDFEKSYLLILANGDVVLTKNNADYVLGNAIVDSKIVNLNFFA